MNTIKTFKNPVLKGFYPDPSICRVDDTYYMVTSSFYYFPGLPVFRSKDLIHWEQIANAISRPGQIDFRNCDSSEGLWAPTIRYHNGKFYIVDTLDVNGRTDRYNFIITAEDPAGEWSDAVIIDGAGGIDPSLFFEEDGTIWYCSNHIAEDLQYPTHKVIYACQLDPETFQIIGEKHIIYDGAVTHSLFMEAPHIYKIDDRYYLMTASGGTQTNHAIDMFQSDSLLGPYEPCPRNPIVTNRTLCINNSLGVAVVGHGDLVETQNGEWYMCLLGIRPYYGKESYSHSARKWIREPDRNKYSQYNLGRETFLLPIAWDYDGWPIVDNDNGYVNLEERKPDLPEYYFPYQSRTDNFESDSLSMMWCMRRPPAEPFWSLEENPGHLRLYLRPETAEDEKQSQVIVRRQQDNDFSVTAKMAFSPGEDEEAGLVVTQNELYQYLLLKEKVSGQPFVSLYKVENGIRTFEGRQPVPADCPVYLQITGRVGSYCFYCGNTERARLAVGDVQDSMLLSTQTADGYLGTMIGMYASSRQKISENYADYDWFVYEPAE